MKLKTLVTTFLLLFAVSNSFAVARDGTRSAEGAGPNGFSKVNETTKDGWTTIVCREVGYTTCPELFVRPADPMDNPLLKDALSAIKSGVLSGTITESGRTVTWKSADTSGNSSTINFHTF